MASAGRLPAPNNALHRVCKIAGIASVTLHGLRRSFSNLAEWAEVPSGIKAQIWAISRPPTLSATTICSPIDLRMWHDKLEAWILNEAGSDFKPEQNRSQPGPQAVSQQSANIAKKR
ncbi:hypothetical protein AB4Y31_15200 [Trinickia sp. EG282A]